LLWDVDLQIVHRTPLVGCEASPSSIPWQSGLALYHRSHGLAGLRCDPRVLGYAGTTTFTKSVRFGIQDVPALRRELGVRFYLVDRKVARDCQSRLAPAIRLLTSHY